MTEKREGPHLCSWCGKEFDTARGLGQHKRYCPDKPSRPEAPASGPTPGLGAPSGGAFYPPKQLVAPKPADKKEGQKAGPSPPPKPEGPERAMDTSSIWKGIGYVLDTYLLKEAEVKIEMNEEKAAILDTSFNLMGWTTKPAKPKELPYWVPFAVTAGSVFGAPIVVYVATNFPEFVENLKSVFGPKVPDIILEEEGGDEPEE